MRIKRSMLFALLLCAVFPAATALCASKPVVYFGVGLRFHPITMYERYQPMMDYLTRNTPYKFELKVSRDYIETLQYLKDGKTDIASIGDGGLMKALLVSGAVPIVKPLNEQGKPVYRSCVVVPAGSPIRTVKDLAGKKVAFGYHHSTTGNLVPRCLLLEGGVRVGELGLVTNLRHHSSVAQAVLKGEYDAGFIKESTAIRFKKKGLRVIAYSAELPSIPIIARPGAPRELTQAITAAFVKLDPKKPGDRRVMESWDLEYKNGFVPATAADYRALSSMFKKKPYGCSAACHK